MHVNQEMDFYEIQKDFTDEEIRKNIIYRKIFSLWLPQKFAP